MSAPNGESAPRLPYTVAPFTGSPAQGQPPDTPAAMIALDADQRNLVAAIAWTVACNNALLAGELFSPIAVSAAAAVTWPGWMPRPVSRAPRPAGPVTLLAATAHASLCRQAGTLVTPDALDRRTRLLTHLEIVPPSAFSNITVPIASSWDSLLTVIETLSLIDVLALIRHPFPIPDEPEAIAFVRASLQHDRPVQAILAAQRANRAALAVAKARINELSEQLAAEREYNRYLNDKLHAAGSRSRFAPARMLRSLAERLKPWAKGDDR